MPNYTTVLFFFSLGVYICCRIKCGLEILCFGTLYAITSHLGIYKRAFSWLLRTITLCRIVLETECVSLLVRV